jgi:uncharacterized protein (TIGR02246 family)
MTNTTRTLDTSTPEALMRAFSDRLHAGDLDGLTALYEPDAAFEPAPDTVVVGRAAIRAALADLLALCPRLVTDTVQVLQGDDVALVVNEWTMHGVAPDGTEVHQGGRSADVVRRQADGSWRVLIDKP